MTETGEEVVLGLFDRGREGLIRSIEHLVDDAPRSIDRARSVLVDEIISRLAYLEDPQHAFAPSLFYCAINLAVYQALKQEGVGVHDYGGAMLRHLESLPPPAQGASEMTFEPPGKHPGEFRVEPAASGEGFDSAFNITSCAICHLFSQFDAMALVPYMCASDDVISDKLGQGLRRSGTIALGHDHCDFRYRSGGEPKRVAESYPEAIRIIAEDAS